jgi:hypothetical protein
MKKRKQNHEQGSTHCFSWSICFFLAIRKTIWQVVWRILLCMQFGTASTILCAWVQQNQIQTHKSAGYKIFPTNKSVDIKSNPDPSHNGRKTHQIASCRYPLLSLILTTQMHHCPSSFFFQKNVVLSPQQTNLLMGMFLEIEKNKMNNFSYWTEFKFGTNINLKFLEGS